MNQHRKVLFSYQNTPRIGEKCAIGLSLYDRKKEQYGRHFHPKRFG